MFLALFLSCQGKRVRAGGILRDVGEAESERAAYIVLVCRRRARVTWCDKGAKSRHYWARLLRRNVGSTHPATRSLITIQAANEQEAPPGSPSSRERAAATCFNDEIMKRAPSIAARHQST